MKGCGLLGPLKLSTCKLVRSKKSSVMQLLALDVKLKKTVLFNESKGKRFFSFKFLFIPGCFVNPTKDTWDEKCILRKMTLP